MKKFGWLLLSSVFISFLITPIAVAQNITSEEKAYVGGYTQGSVDSLTRLALLDDNTFCFSVTAGSLDLLAAGHWKSNTKDTSISLHEVRTDKPLFPALIKKVKEQGDSVVFNFDGYSLSNAESAVFAVSATDAQPTSFRPLFSPENTSWAERYTLPPIKAGNARYFFIGHGEADKYGRPLRLKIVQYKLSESNTVLVGFDNIQATPLMNMSAKLINNILYVDGQKFGKKDSLPPEIMQQARENCVYPAMQPNKVKPKSKCVKKPGSDCEEEDEPENNDPLAVPIKTFNVDLNAIKGEPWIDRKKANSEPTSGK